MEILNFNHIRYFDNGELTLGRLHLEDEFFCYILEDTFREKKIQDETRIPAGRYEIKLRKAGGMYPRYKQAYGTDGMIHLQDVPGFTYIYMHPGATQENTSGCLLVGTSLYFSNELIRLSSQDNIYNTLHAYVAEGLDQGQVFINIFNNY